MTIRVQGVLTDPLGNAVVNVPIKVVTTNGFGDVLTTAEAIYFTDGLGNYDFDLAYATHNLYVMFTDTYEFIGVTVANESLTDPSYTISDLLHYSTPLPSQAEEEIRNDFDSCISDLETAFDTCILQLSDQVVQGDTGVCSAMTTYTNDRLQACSAELTDTIVAGDAQVLAESQAYADATGAQITCCTNQLTTDLASVCSTLTAYTTSNDIAITCLCTDMQAGDAQTLQTAQAYSDTCSGIVCSSLVNMVQACDAYAQTCMTALNTCIVDTDTALRGYTDACTALCSQDSKDYIDNNFVDQVSYNTCIADIQSQIDKSVTNWFADGVPTLANYPANQWTDDPTKDQHLGDLYYDNLTGKSYRFQYNSTTLVYEWFEVVDTDLQAALDAAAQAQDTADGKRRVFFATPVPPYDPGDLWDTGDGLKRAQTASTTTYDPSHWVDVSDGAGSAAEAQAAAEAYADAQANLAEVCANAYADGIVTAEEQRAIADAQAKADAAEAAANAYTDGCVGNVHDEVDQLVTCTQGLTGDIVVLQSDVCDNGGNIELQQSGYEIVTSAGDATASIALLSTAYTNTAVACSEILMQADKIAMHNGDSTDYNYPFYIENNTVYMDSAYIQCLTGDKIVSNTTIRAGSGINSAGMNGDDSGSAVTNRNMSYRFWAGSEYARDSGGNPVAPFRVTNTGAVIASNAYITGCINTTCLVFDSPSAVPPEITNAQLTADNANSAASTACSCAITAQNQAQLAQTAGNMLDMRPWVQGFTGGGRWGRNGSTNENAVVAGNGPYAAGALLWRMKTNSSGNSDGDGGWNYDVTQTDGLDSSKTYVMTVWMQQNSTNGTLYFGTSSNGTVKQAGASSAHNNPYFWSGDLPTLGKWYLVVGVVHGSGYTGGDSGTAGVYDPTTGAKVLDGTEYQMFSNATTLRHRAFWYYSTDTSSYQYLARPTVHTGEDFPGVDTLLNQAYQRAATAEANACSKAASACSCGINCGNAAKSCAASEGSSARSCAINCGNAAKTCGNCACKCAINCGNRAIGCACYACCCARYCSTAACNYADGSVQRAKNAGQIYPSQTNIQIKSANYQAGVCGWAVDCYGNSEFNKTVIRGTLYAATGCFCGKLYAQCIVGDVTSNMTKNTPCVSTPNNGTCAVFTWFCVRYGRPYSRQFEVSAAIAAHGGSYHVGNGDYCCYSGDARLKIVTPWGTSYSAWITSPEAATAWTQATAGMCVPANSTGKVCVYIVRNGGYASACGMNNGCTSAKLYRNGTDLC